METEENGENERVSERIHSICKPTGTIESWPTPEVIYEKSTCVFLLVARFPVLLKHN